MKYLSDLETSHCSIPLLSVCNRQLSQGSVYVLRHDKHKCEGGRELLKRRDLETELDNLIHLFWEHQQSLKIQGLYLLLSILSQVREWSV